MGRDRGAILARTYVFVKNNHYTITTAVRINTLLLLLWHYDVRRVLPRVCSYRCTHR